MAKIKGTFITDPYYFDDFDDPDLAGTAEDDTIDGLGGNDHIWGGLGDDKMWGGNGDDTIEPQAYDAPGVVADWGDDEAHGGIGNDTLDFRYTTHDGLKLYGDEGMDTIVGGRGMDFIQGGPGIDFLYGFGGDDFIEGDAPDWGSQETDYVYAGEGSDLVFGYGGDDELFGDGGDDDLAGFEGNDRVCGGYGNDELWGDSWHGGGGVAGQDELWGGSGVDTFFFNKLDGNPANPDHIVDFEPTAYLRPGDKIDVMGPAGTASNFFGLSINDAGGYDVAKGLAENYIGGDTRYVFVTDTVDGYFFSDVDGDGALDNGIVLEGLTSLTDFGYQNIVDLW